MMTDPIADMITRIRNAQRARHLRTSLPASQLKLAVAKVLEAEGYVEDVRVDDEEGMKVLSLALRYRRDGSEMVDGIRRVSKPGRRVYVGSKEVPKVRNGLGVGVLSTSKGLMTDRDARAQNVGGELLLEVW